MSRPRGVCLVDLGVRMYRPSLLIRLIARISQALDHRLGWDKLPVPLGLLALLGIRETLREENLYDSYAGHPPAITHPPGDFSARTVDGSYNDPKAPSMGMANTRFGRNVPDLHARPELEPLLLDPNPRTVSDELLLRNEFKPATSLN